MGNAGGIVASQIYRSQDSPRFLLGHGITLGFCVVRIPLFPILDASTSRSLSLLLVTPQPLPLLTRLLRLSSVTYSSASSSLARFTSSSRGRTLVETEFTDRLLLLPCSARTTRPRSSSSSVSLRCQRGRSWPSETIIPLSDSSPRWGGLEFGLTGESTRFENESRRDGQSTSLTALLLLVPSSAHPVVDLKSPESE